VHTGTNPASASMAGFDVVEIKSGSDGCVNLEELKAHLMIQWQL